MQFDAPISVETPTKAWAKPIRSCHWVKFKQYRFCQAHAPLVPSRGRDGGVEISSLENGHATSFFRMPVLLPLHTQNPALTKNS
jgi:hypothetical protein